MRASACVGRVGGLAVALGIGVALTVGGAEPAWASPEDVASSGEGSAAGITSTGGQGLRSSVRSRGGRSQAATPEGGTAAYQAAVPRSAFPIKTAAALEPANKPSTAAKVVTSAPVSPRLTAPTDALNLPSLASAANVDLGQAATAAVQSVATPVVDAPVATAVATAPEMVSAGTAGVDSAWNPLLGRNPLAPVQSAISWVVMAAARRERAGSPTAQNKPAAEASISDLTDTGSLPSTVGPAGATVPAAATLAASSASAQSVTLAAAEIAADPITAFIGQIQSFVTQIVQAVTQVVTQVVQTITQAITAVVNVFVPAPTPTPTPVPVNAAPVATTPTVGTPDTVTGAVIGQINATDPNGDTLTYSAPANTTKGSVVMNAGTGAFTYTPTATARQNAAQGGTAAADTFTVTVTDGNGGTTNFQVGVIVSPT